MLTNLWQSIIQLSLAALAIIIITYMIYVIDLSVVFRRLGVNPQYNFIPRHNYIALLIIAFSKIALDLNVIDEPAPKIDPKKLRKLSLHPNKAKNKV